MSAKAGDPNLHVGVVFEDTPFGMVSKGDFLGP